MAVQREILITGGAGFVGANLAARLLAEGGNNVAIFDNLSRRGTEHNLSWLRTLPQAKNLRYIHGDVRNAQQVSDAARYATQIYHLAAQVAVTTSITDPKCDFDTNALGTFHVLEAARRHGRQPMVFFTSTNKVYGSLESVPVEKAGTRYRATDRKFIGADESTPLDFHSPYGCSKGAADQYVRDYARIYDLPTVVFRMSCIAGQRQFGNEDQGWVAHFLYSVLSGRAITVYGDGLQVRDILHIDDLVNAFVAARDNIGSTAGHVYNVGGGMGRAISIRELLEKIERRVERPARLEFSDTRPGDQPLYVSNTTRLESHTGWKAALSLDQILDSIEAFYSANRGLIAQRPAASADAKPLSDKGFSSALSTPALATAEAR
ncbi:GDP-mannose 4,6-dehydratase [Terriglobus aquaticus]|uniref:GDP-mannose 4,6-dehydratase n=1 Tax=Terriglobus aquaticus TaxID=940139 RepID=A0ABW9KN85_9BACT|nr:GDP-mannose 4,6-dehydratase [Terriglobus aquaticus]